MAETKETFPNYAWQKICLLTPDLCLWGGRDALLAALQAVIQASTQVPVNAKPRKMLEDLNAWVDKDTRRPLDEEETREFAKAFFAFHTYLDRESYRLHPEVYAVESDV